MNTIVLDSNIYDRLATDPTRCDCLRELIHQGLVEVLVSPVVHDQLLASPFNGVPSLFPVRLISEAVAIAGVAKAGLARVGTGEVFTQHLGASDQYEDAIIAETANCDAGIFVSEDNRCRKRLKTISATLQCLNYDEFAAWLESHQFANPTLKRDWREAASPLAPR